jgi:hypothetical protein
MKMKMCQTINQTICQTIYKRKKTFTYFQKNHNTSSVFLPSQNLRSLSFQGGFSSIIHEYDLLIDVIIQIMQFVCNGLYIKITFFEYPIQQRYFYIM